MPRSRSVLVLSGFTRRRREGSTESGNTTHRAPAGMDPTAVPLAASLTNSSPLSAPPIDALESPTARPMRSSGSPTTGGGARDGRGQAAVAISARLVSACFGECRIKLLDGEVDIGVGVRGRDEAGLEGGRREEHTPRERGLVPVREQRGVGSLRVGVVPNGAFREIDAPHRPRMSDCDY